MLAWFGGLAQAIFQLGYPGVLVALTIEGTGLPFPGDAAMAFYGFGTAEGRLRWSLVLVVCVIGYMLGASIAYGVGRAFSSTFHRGVGLQRIGRFLGISQRSMTRTTNLMERFGPVLLIVGRFLPGIRSVSSYAAGLTKMPFQPFFLYTFIGTVLWCSTWLGLGYLLEENVTRVLHFAQSSLAYVTIGLVIGVAIWLVWRRRQRPL